ncbi:hypothetical protein [Stenotrophomonas phage CM2]
MNELARLNAISENVNGGNHASQVSAFLASEQRSRRRLRVQGALRIEGNGDQSPGTAEGHQPGPD